MENIYQETFTAIENGANFRIYFRSRNLKVDGRHVIRDGRFDGTLGLPEYGGGDFSRMWKNCTAATSTDTIGAQPEQVPTVFHGIARK